MKRVWLVPHRGPHTNSQKTWLRNPKRRYLLADLNVSKIYLIEATFTFRLNQFLAREIRTAGLLCIHSIPASSIKDNNCVDYLSEYWLLTKDSWQWSHLAGSYCRQLRIALFTLLCNFFFWQTFSHSTTLTAFSPRLSVSYILIYPSVSLPSRQTLSFHIFLCIIFFISSVRIRLYSSATEAKRMYVFYISRL
jgi:hypothetical protein